MSRSLFFQAMNSGSLKRRQRSARRSRQRDVSRISAMIEKLEDKTLLAAPVIEDQFFIVDENTAEGEPVGVVVATDDDMGDTLTYAITGGNALGAFAIDADTGEITVADETVLDAEVNPVFNLTVSVSDSGNPDPGGIGVWVSVGPNSITDGQVEGQDAQNNPVSGAVHTVLPHPNDSDILYIGTINGGIWRTNNATASSPTWTPLTDDLPSLSTGALEFDAADATHQTIVAGVGRFSSIGGIGGDRIGLLRTIDGGDTWTVLDAGGSLVGKNISGLQVNGNNIVISVNVADSFTYSNVGIFRSTNGGTSFTQMSVGDGSSTGLPGGVAYDLVADPNDPNVLYTSITQAGGVGGTNGIYKSTNGGATWTKVSTALVDSAIADTNRNIEFAVGNSGEVYAGIINSFGQLGGLFRSGNAGATWTQLDTPVTNENGIDVGLNPNDLDPLGDENGDGVIDLTEGAAIAGGQGSIHFSIAADPTNNNIVYVGGDRQPTSNGDAGGFPNSIGAQNYSGRLFRVDASLASGSQAATLTHLQGTSTSSNSSPHADSREIKFDADGNLIEGDDGGVYRRTNPQGLGDWFSVIGDLANTEFHSIGYDSNSDVIFGGTQDVGTPEQPNSSANIFRSVSQGDGGVVAVDNISLAGSGQSIRYTSFQFLQALRRRVVDASGNVISTAFPALAGLGGSAQFYTPIATNNVAGDRLVIAQTNGIYESTDQGDSVTQISGSPTSATSFVYGGRLSGANNADILYAGDNLGVFLRTTSGGAMSAVAGYNGGTVQDLTVDTEAWTTLFVIDNNQVFFSTNAGTTFTDITNDLATLSNGTFDSIEFVEGTARDAIVVGTGTGAFVSFTDDLGNWTELGNLPNARVFDLDYDAGDDVLVAGLLGRGAWTLDTNAIFAPGTPELIAPATDAAIVNITLNDLYEPSIANPDGPFNALEDANVNIPRSVLLANDPPGNNQNTELVGISQPSPAQGRLLDNGDGTFLFVPTADYSGVASFEYTISNLAEQKLTASDAVADHSFGQAVAIDGDTMVVGAPLDDTTGTNAGAAYIYLWNGTQWNFDQKLTTANATAGDRFGIAVAIEGDRIVIGSSRDDQRASNAGSAYIFDRTGGTWSETAKLFATDAAAADQFGVTVALEGDIAVIGSSLADVSGNINSGAAYVFNTSSGSWIQTQKLTAGADLEADARFGRSVDIDGTRIIVGAQKDDGPGAAYVFENIGGGIFALDGKLSSSDGAAGDQFGVSVSLQGDTAVIGAVNHGTAGAAYIFSRAGGSWMEEQKLSPADLEPGALFGQSVQLDGEFLIVGAAFGNSFVDDAGSAILYRNIAGSFSRIGQFTASDGEMNERFGESVAISGDRIAIGARDATASLSEQGAVYGYSTEVSTAVATLDVMPLEDAPRIEDQVFNLVENPVTGQSVGFIEAFDPDPGDQIVYEIVSGNTNAAFDLDAVTGELKVLNALVVDFETNPVFNLVVKVTDNNNPDLQTEADVTVNILDLNEFPARLGDYVFLDANGDGIQNSGELGVRNIAVELWNPGDDGMIGGGDDLLVASTTTNKWGVYRFEGLPEDDYFLSFTAPANGLVFSPQSVGNWKRDSDVDPATGLTNVFHLTGGKTDFTRDAGLMDPMTTSIGNRVWSDDNGNGLQDSGEAGFEGADVDLWSVGADGVIGGGDDTQIASRSTNARGEFEFTGLAGGTYYLQFVEPIGKDFTTQFAGDWKRDSEPDPTTGRTPAFTLAIGKQDVSRDAGVIDEPVIPPADTSREDRSASVTTGDAASTIPLGDTPPAAVTGGEQDDDEAAPVTSDTGEAYEDALDALFTDEELFAGL